MPGESHGQRSPEIYGPKKSDTTEMISHSNTHSEYNITVLPNMLWFTLKKLKNNTFFYKEQTLATHHSLLLLLFRNDEIQDRNQEP